MQKRNGNWVAQTDAMSVSDTLMRMIFIFCFAKFYRVDQKLEKLLPVVLMILVNMPIISIGILTTAEYLPLVGCGL